MGYTAKMLIVCCLMPLAGTGVGISLLKKGLARQKNGAGATEMAAGQLISIGRRSTVTAVLALVLTIAVVLALGGFSHKVRLIAAFVLITLQYITVMATAVKISRQIRRK